MTSLGFFVPGVVSAQGSKRHVGHGVLIDTNRNLSPWRDSIAYAARESAVSELNWAAWNHGPVFTGPVIVQLHAVYARPKSHYRTGKNADVLRDDAPVWKSSSPDLDKIARAANDALTQSGIWRDDAQVAALNCLKSYGTPGLHVSIQDAGEDVA